MHRPPPFSITTGPHCGAPRGWVEGSGMSRIQTAGGLMRKVFRSGPLALIGLAATVVPVLTAAAGPPAAGAATPRAATAGTSAAGTSAPHLKPGLYHMPIVGKVTLPGLGSSLGGVRHATAVQSSNWSGYADIDDTFNSVAASWTEPKASCSSSSGGLSGLLGGPEHGGRLLGRSRRLHLDQRRAVGYRLGLRRHHTQLLRLVRDVPQPFSDAAQHGAAR